MAVHSYRGPSWAIVCHLVLFTCRLIELFPLVVFHLLFPFVAQHVLCVSSRRGEHVFSGLSKILRRWHRGGPERRAMTTPDANTPGTQEQLASFYTRATAPLQQLLAKRECCSMLCSMCCLHSGFVGGVREHISFM